MNTINSIGSQIFRGSTNTNSVSYVNRQNVNVTLDPSGTDYVDYSNNAIYFHDAHGININNENTTSLVVNKTSSPFFLSSLDEFTFFMKYKVHDVPKSSILGQFYTNPNYSIIIPNPSPNVGDTFTITILNGYNANLTYTISGDLTSADLNNADMSGTLTTIENHLTYTLNSGSGQFLILLDNTDISASFNVLKTYFVIVQANVIGEPVFAFSESGETGLYYNQPDLSFGAGDQVLFNVSQIDGSYSLVFGTTVDDAATIQTQYYSKTGDIIFLSIPADYSGDSLKYFEDTSAGMGYVSIGGSGNTLIESDFVNTVATTPPTNSLLYSQNNPLSFTASNVENTFANGDYIIEASSQDGNGHIARCINNTQTIQGYHWHGYPANYASKVYTGTVNTTIGATIISGEWIQLTMPYRMVLKKLLLGGRADYYQSYPGLIYMVGSNDGGTTFEIIDSSKTLSLDGVAADTGGNIGDDNSAVNQTETTFSTTYSYSTIRMVVNELIPTTYNMPVNAGRWELTGDVVEVASIENYTVDVSNGVFRLDSGDDNGFVDKPSISFTSGTTYIFNQSDPTNAGNTLVLGTVPDSSVNLIDYQTIVGTPGQPGAYTSFTASGETVYYYSFETPDMGYFPSYLATNYNITSGMTLSGVSGSVNNRSWTQTSGSDSFTDGTYNVSYPTSGYNGSNSENLFNNNNNDLAFYAQGYYNYGNANTSGTHAVTKASSQNYYGSYVQITLPYKLLLKQIDIVGHVISGIDIRPRTPYMVYLFGSNDGGTNFTYLGVEYFPYPSTSNANTTSITIATITEGYYTIRMVINKTQRQRSGISDTNNYGSSPTALSQWQLIGDVLPL